MRNPVARCVVAASLLVLLGGCNVVPYDKWARANEARCADDGAVSCDRKTTGLQQVSMGEPSSPPPSQKVIQRAKEVIEKGALGSGGKDKIFVGIALSGGGSRAANFSLAALLKLDEENLLEPLTAISSVSGGSLSAAYFGLHHGGDAWREAAKSPCALKAHFRQDLQNIWVGRWLLPQNIFRYWLSPYDRSDIMKGVIDEFLATRPPLRSHEGLSTTSADAGMANFQATLPTDPPCPGSSQTTPAAEKKDGCENGQCSQTVPTTEQCPTPAKIDTPIRFSALETSCVRPGTYPLPRIYLNATTMDGRNFVFSDEMLDDLGSRLDTYPLADAVMASAAFPGGFQRVTLQRYRSPYPIPRAPQTHNGPAEATGAAAAYALAVVPGRTDLDDLPDSDPRPDPKAWPKPNRNLYVHLLDGGANDNLGARTLIRTLQASEEKFEHCALVIVDSYTDPLDKKWSREAGFLAIHDDDPRRFADYLVDTDALTAFDTLLSNNRENLLRTLGYPARKVGETSFWLTQPLKSLAVRHPGNRELACHVWHLSFQRLKHLDGEACQGRRVARLANETATAFRLDSPGNHNAKALQDNLFEAAECLIARDSVRFDSRSSMLPEQDVKALSCGSAAAGDQASVLKFMQACYQVWGIGRQREQSLQRASR